MKNEIYRIVRTLLPIADDISLTDDTPLTEFGLDSMLFIELIVQTEAHFDIEIPDEYLMMPMLDTIEKIYKMVEFLKASSYTNKLAETE